MFCLYLLCFLKSFFYNYDLKAIYVSMHVRQIILFSNKGTLLYKLLYLYLAMLMINIMLSSND